MLCTLAIAEKVYEVKTLENGKIPASVFTDTSITKLIVKDKSLKRVSPRIKNLVKLRKQDLSGN